MPVVRICWENPDWFDALSCSIVTTPGDELIFRVNGYAVFANPEDTPIAMSRTSQLQETGGATNIGAPC